MLGGFLHLWVGIICLPLLGSSIVSLPYSRRETDAYNCARRLNTLRFSGSVLCMYLLKSWTKIETEFVKRYRHITDITSLSCEDNSLYTIVQSSFHLFLGQSKCTWESHLGETWSIEIYNCLFAGMQLLNLQEIIFGNTLQKIQKSTCFEVNYRT